MMLRRLIALSAFVVVASCGGGTTTAPAPPVTPTPPAPAPAPAPSPTPTPAPVTVAVTILTGARNLGNLAYSPNPITVAVGTTVTWTNADTATHGAVNDAGAFAGGRVGPGESISATFQTAGTVPYHCPIHSGMTGSIVVQ